MESTNKLIENLNQRITNQRSSLNQLIVDVIFELKSMMIQVDNLYSENKELRQKNAMMRDAITLALHAMDGGFVEKVDYKQFLLIKETIGKTLETA